MFPYLSPEISGNLGNSSGVPVPSWDFSWIFPYSSPECSGKLCISLGISVPSPDFSGIVPFPGSALSSQICLVTCSHTGVFRDSSLPQPRIIIANSCDVPVPRPEYFGMVPFPILELLQFYSCISADQKKRAAMEFLLQYKTIQHI